MQRIKSLLVIVALVMAVQPVFAQKSSSEEAVRRLYRQAVDLYQKEKYASAQNLFDRLTAEGTGVDAEMASEAAFYGAVCAERWATAMLISGSRSSCASTLKTSIPTWPISTLAITIMRRATTPRR